MLRLPYLLSILAIPLLFSTGCQTPQQATQQTYSQNLSNNKRFAQKPIEHVSAEHLKPAQEKAESQARVQAAGFQQPASVSSEDAVGARSGISDSETTSTESLSHLPVQAEPTAIPEALVDNEVLLTSATTLADLEGIALQNNPALAEKCSLVEAARGNWEQVGLPPNPVVGYSGQQLGSGGTAEQQGVYLGQEIVRGGKLRLNREVAAWEVQKAEREYQAFRLRVLTDVRIAYYDVLIAQQRRQRAEELLEVSSQGVQAAEALFKGDEVSEADPLRAKIEADNARIVLQNAINLHVAAWRKLSAIIGMPNLAIQTVEGELKPEDLTIVWHDELSRVLSDSPEIAAALANVEAANWAVQRACAQVIPNIDIQAVIQDDRGTGGTNGNLQVSMPIPIWNRNQGGIRKAEAEAIAAQRKAERVALDLQARLATAFQQYENARNQAELYSKKNGILENSKRTLELIRKGYKADEFGVLDLLSAQRTYFQTNLAYLDSLRELSVAVMEIRGMMLRGSLGN